MACSRKTRSGKDFSPYLNANPIACLPLFELAKLLQELVARESDELAEGPLQGPAQEDEGERHPARDATLPTQKRAASPAAPGQSRTHQRRSQARDKAAVEKGQFPRARTVASYVAPSASLLTGLVTEGLPAAKGRYSTKQGPSVGAKKAQQATQLVEEGGFDYVVWNGYEPRPLLDHAGRIYSVLVGQPRDETYLASAHHCHKTILEQGCCKHFEPEERRHCHGNFPAINVGITYGKGSPSPTNLNNEGHHGMVERLLTNTDVKRLATFASASFATWAPEVYGYYKERLDKLWTHLPHRRNFATITHSNTPIQQGETWTSFTQFCASALFRFVDNGFWTEAALEEEDPSEYQRMLE